MKVESLWLQKRSTGPALEYADQKNEHPKIKLVTPEALQKQILEGNLPQFDAMVTFSSIEHSGLGRYGDSLNPWGDLITMAQSWCLLKPGEIKSYEIKRSIAVAKKIRPLTA